MHCSIVIVGTRFIVAEIIDAIVANELEVKMRIPKHIGIIPDGNRRWAASERMNKQDGYHHGLQPGLSVLKQAIKYGVKEITYYGFTVDNCKRPPEQVESFQKACVDAVELIAHEDVNVYVIGNTESKFFPKELLAYTKRKQGNEGKINVNILVNYGWKWDIAHGIDNSKSKDIPRIDMIIRWGGMRRLSGFLPVQSVYADFFVVDSLWPDYKDEDFDQAIQWYQKQDVTLGG